MSRDKEQYNEYQREYQLRRYHKRRAESIETLGGKCFLCGSTNRLELDHIDPATKAFPIAKLWSLSKAKYEAELAKCQLLCRECHTRKSAYETMVRRPFTHGKYWAVYKHKCRCPECDSFRVEFNKKRAEARKSLGP